MADEQMVNFDNDGQYQWSVRKTGHINMHKECADMTALSTYSKILTRGTSPSFTRVNTKKPKKKLAL